jgi:CheY-like chemotaxis protein
MAKLVVINQGLAGLSLELSENWATIGRGNGNALQIIETSVSGKHCEVQLSGNELNIRDLRSTNGTFVRGQKIAEAVLKPGQTLRLGQVELRFEGEVSAPVIPKSPLSAPHPVSRSVPVVPAAPVIPVAPAAPKPMRPVVPSVAAAVAPAPVSPTPSAIKVELAAPPGKRYNILFVDDNEAFLSMFTELCTTLANKQWEIHVALTGDRALEVLRRLSIDLVVLDISMPMVDGIQLLNIIKRRYHDVKVAVLTSHGTEANRTTCLSGGAEIFIEKPTVADGFKVVFNMLNDLVSWTQHREGFSGTVRQVGLQEVIQMECLGRHSSVLEIRNQNANGQIYIESGAIVHAETTDLSGEKALQLLLSLTGGEFRLLQFKAPKGRTIDGSWEFLLMEAARLRDEEHHTATLARQALEPVKSPIQPVPAASTGGTNPPAAAKPAAVTTPAVPAPAPKPSAPPAPAHEPPATPAPVAPASPEAAKGKPGKETPEKSAPENASAHSLGDDVVVVATYDGKWHPSNSPKK